MSTSPLFIRPYRIDDQYAVIALWHDTGLVRPPNDPAGDIALKVAHSPELFLVGTVDDIIVATVMIGYEGHRGWINYLAVATTRQSGSIGRQMMEHAELLLRSMGCPKINLQVRTTNEKVVAFYEKLGFKQDHVISLGKRLTD
jgi:ribosomal protein S18 acetylase RimI-like enzyme